MPPEHYAPKTLFPQTLIRPFSLHLLVAGVAFGLIHSPLVLLQHLAGL